MRKNAIRFSRVFFAVLLICLLLTPAMGTEAIVYGRHPNTVSNIGAFVTDGSFHYYILNSYWEGPPNRIIKESIRDGSKKIIYQGTPWNDSDGGTSFRGLNISDNWLYFIYHESVWDGARLGSKESICRIHLDGTGFAKLYGIQYVGSGCIRDILIMNKKIYFLSETKIFQDVKLMSLNLDGSGAECLLEGRFYNLCAFNGQLLLLLPYDNPETIVHYDPNNRNCHKVTLRYPDLTGRANNLQVSATGQPYVCFSSTNKYADNGNSIKPVPPCLYSFSVNGTNVEKISEGLNSHIIIGNDILRYNYSDGNIYLGPLDEHRASIKITETEVEPVFYYHNGYLFAYEKGSTQLVHIYPTGHPVIDLNNANITKLSFTDVPIGLWYSDPVAWAVQKEITNGTSTTKFSPSQNCTHAQILTFLYRADRGEGKAEAEASDMEKAVSWAKQKDMIDNSFDGGKFCTRAEAVNYIWQAFDKPTAKASSFTDVPSTSAYAKAVSWAVEKGVTNGTNAAQTQFSPDKICDRGTIVTFLYRAYNN